MIKSNNMRTNGIIILLLLGLGNVFGQTYNTPVTYFDYFNREHTAIVQKNMEYLQHAVHSENLIEIAQQRLGLLEQVQGATERVQSIAPFERDAGMQEEMLAVLGIYNEIFDIDFSQVEALKSDSRDSFEAMEQYMAAHEEAERKLAAASARFLAAQRAFADANNITLVEGAQNTEIEQMNQLNTYQRSLFLRHFKINQLNASFLDALDKQADELLENSRIALLNACDEELPSLRELDGFSGDTGYRDAIIEQMETIRDMAAEEYETLSRVTTADPSSLTQTDVDAYNAAIQRVNTVLNPLAENVNNALQQLLRNNVPKPAVRGTKQI